MKKLFIIALCVSLAGCANFVQKVQTFSTNYQATIASINAANGAINAYCQNIPQDIPGTIAAVTAAVNAAKTGYQNVKSGA